MNFLVLRRAKASGYGYSARFGRWVKVGAYHDRDTAYTRAVRLSKNKFYEYTVVEITHTVSPVPEPAFQLTPIG